tara:strand:+ start:498 stop:902 length:405 start_codon:yes stop_codon:yes gene_type:complete
MTFLTSALGKLIKRLKKPPKKSKPTTEAKKGPVTPIITRHETAAKYRTDEFKDKRLGHARENIRGQANRIRDDFNKKFPDDRIRDENTYGRGAGLLKKIARKIDPKMEPVERNRIARKLRRADAMTRRNKTEKE